MSDNANRSRLDAPECQDAGDLGRVQAQLHETQQALARTRKELAHVSRVASLGLLTAAITHEVNQPLSGILTNAGTCLRILASNDPNLERARETARRTIRDCERASEVISRLRRLFAKGDTAAEEFDLGEAAREVIALMAHELRRNDVRVRLDLASGLPPVCADRVQLQQVVLNLVLNATEAMREVSGRSRKLTIRTERPSEGHVHLSVKDVGPGFDPGAAEQLFQPFFTSKPGGMGIGLAVSRSMVEYHCGRLWAALNDDGPGATFFLSIPCANAMVRRAS